MRRHYKGNTELFEDVPDFKFEVGFVFILDLLAIIIGFSILELVLR